MSLSSRKTNIGLWTAQALLSILFIFGGSFKLVASPAALAQMTHFSPLFMKFIGLCEVAGGLGLILPGIFRVRTELTSLAATGLAIIMVGAVTTTIVTLGAGPAIFPCIIGAVAITIARGRWPRTQQLREASRFPASLQAAGGR